jgi:hypothetical protein
MKSKAIILACALALHDLHLHGWKDAYRMLLIWSLPMLSERLTENQTSTALACLFLCLLALAVQLLVATLLLGLVVVVIPGLL